MPRVRIKKLPSGKRRVRIKRLPQYTGLPNSVPYAGLQRFIYTNGGVAGGIDSTIGKNPITFGLQNSEDLLANPFTQTASNPFVNPLTGKSSGLVMNQEGELEETVKKEEGTEGTGGNQFYTEDFKEGFGIIGGQSAALQGTADARMIAGFGQRRKQQKREGDSIAYGDETGRKSSRLDEGDYVANDGLFRPDKMGAKVLNVTQQGGALRQLKPGGVVAIVDGTPMTQAQLNAYRKNNPNAQVRTVTQADIDAGGYTKLGDNLYGKGQAGKTRTIERSSGTTKFSGTDAQYSANICEAMKNGAYKGVSAEEMARTGKISSSRIAEFKGCENIEQEAEFVQLDTPEVVEETTVEKDDTPAATKCPCPNDPKEGPFTGTIVTGEDGKKECECSGVKDVVTQQQTQTQDPTDPAFWLQDTIKTTGIAGDLATLRKYTPQLQQVDLEEGDATFVDPTRALAANAEQANIAAQAASSFAGPQGTARLSAIQGKAAGQAANILDKTNQQNVGIANQIAQANQNIRNQEALQNAKFRQQYYDQSTIANQQFDNSQRAMRSALRDQFANAITNKMTTDAMNQMYPNYAVDPSTGGRTLFTGSDGRQPSPTYQQNYDTFYNKAIERGMKPVDADKSARARADKQLLSESGAAGTPRYGGYPGSASGRYGSTTGSMLGGSVYEHGGAHKAPFGSSNRGGIEPSSYTSGFNQNNIPFGSQTTSTIGAVPRKDANLEAEGGETVFGDINGDGFPETNKITGPRHAQGGVPLNLPDDSFIFSDYKKGTMKISDPEVLKMFGKSGKKRKGSRKKPSYTPAELAKQYDVNKYRALLQDPNADNISRRTAELMIENYNMKLGALALVQESSKGFPQGVPKVARPYMDENGITEQELIPQQQPQNTVQRPAEQFFSDAEVIEEQT